MDEQERRLASCFLAVFPELSWDDVTHATSTTVQGWDSVAVVTLLAVVEEEFGISLEVEDLSQFDSFQRFLIYMGEVGRGQQAATDLA
jgi:acyl carrier protein